jgi:spore coat polysaccharide biosynthesis predicted glycosyltransferase SpsG
VDESVVGPLSGDIPVRSTPATVEGARDACRALGAAALVVDSYHLSHDDLRALHPAGRSLVVVDDFGQWPVPGDLVVNTAAGLTPPRDDGEHYLLGPHYALLAPPFAETPRRPSRASVERILLAVGGSTPASLMVLVARAARTAAPSAILDVVVGPMGDDAVVLRRALADVSDVQFHEGRASLRVLMLESDLAVTAGGVTLLELAATAIPTVGVCVARNQMANLVGLAAEEAVMFGGSHDDPRLPERLVAALSALVGDSEARARLGRRARMVVDGQGARRVAERIRLGLPVDSPARVGREAGR